MSRIGEEWAEGRYPKHFEVLDIGAGTSPAPGATRAVDANRDLFTKSGKRLKKKVEIPDSLIEYINYDASNLPYENDFFDRGISRWGIGARIKGLKPIRELFRVMKRKGEVYIAILEEDQETIPVTKRLLKKAGFEMIDVYTGEYSEGNGVKAKEFIIHVRKPRRV